MGRRKRGQDIHGWVLLDKPLDMTSTQAVSAVRRLFDAKKAGHAGTLDPLATGMLPIALGEATKTVPFAQDAGKIYRFAIRWGVSTDTLDTEGKVVATSDVRPDIEAIKVKLPDFVGDIEQIPPKYSAIKIDGERAYDLARAGEDVEIAARPVRIDRLDIIGAPSADETVFEMECGKGTYVRAIARDLSLKLGTEGHISSLRRTAVGVFEESAAISLDELSDLAHKGRAFEGLAPVETALDDIPALAVTEEEASHLRQGRSIVLLPRIAQELRAQRRPRDLSGKDGSRLAVAMYGGMAVALGDAQAGKFVPARVFNHSL
ncbi:MAG: tRNA pseudouridine(55) synthase TruB [Rhodobacterales bacterium CG15_BIG_FIL_POST_REV_8_21_14_020_59_13]|nr:MAG: tRNA pseudouridine(55) synthase TruB [Rhodobacterales bacterium CG15_BIG_FIL_POST_REV_8_21_14_020_59_13]